MTYKVPAHNHGPHEGLGLLCPEVVVNGFARGACMWYDTSSPHSRACGISQHDHGSWCHSNCQTCAGLDPPIPLQEPVGLYTLRDILLADDRHLWLHPEDAMDMAKALVKAGYRPPSI